MVSALLCHFYPILPTSLSALPSQHAQDFRVRFSAVAYLRLKQRHNIPGADVWSCNGTPVDCVKIALDRLCGGRRPDLILGGINHGDNSSVNNHYSGTMGVALEGCMKYIPSIAFSSCDYNENADLSYLRDHVRDMVRRVLTDGLPKGVCLNVNFPKIDPSTEQFAGVRVCRMGFGSWINEVVKCHHPRGYDYYWMVGEYRDDEPGATDNDRWALAHKYIAVTPTRVDVTDYDQIRAMSDWNE